MGSPANPDVLTSLIAGAAAGVVVDLSLFPLDTIKTRLQSKSGFLKTGGFSGVYKGIVPVLIGSAPTSAIFFMTYNTLLNSLSPVTGFWGPVNQVVAASCAEFVAASLRVPIEIVKQRKQVSLKSISGIDLVKAILREEGVRGMYRGFSSTLSREIPFGCIQYPLWEWLKLSTGAHQSWHIGLCGAAAGGIAAAATTPMDVIKTRVMLAEGNLDTRRRSLWSLTSLVAREIIQERGIAGLFSGVVPRVLWITIGGFIYFGVYGKAVLLCGPLAQAPLSDVSGLVNNTSSSGNLIKLER